MGKDNSMDLLIKRNKRKLDSVTHNEFKEKILIVEDNMYSAYAMTSIL